MSALDEFLAGERLEDVVLFVSDDFLDDDSRLRSIGTERENGVLLVVDGERGRSAFQAGTGMDAMGFAKQAMGTDGTIARTLDGATCPAADDASAGGPDEDHAISFIFAFAEAENEEVGGLYAEGDVVHAYAQCECGESFSHKWVVGERE
ncbi:DUF5807 family protein [Halopenitus persicus]|uniref:Uncharacterized protein n=1 Tax=Halopenitus persicus TaxID=1048396 RepID=A0A1H3FYU4_9EURY|nr:DUF5807 family protein [Halopenitus persicus]QHS16812.1 hypothetical protein GWK26_06440 [haloarchaeon 3A1-DGR]SDX95279.1 hypothetical protein SAMN05216564_102235 [Halopenitus persicus]